MVMCSVIYKLTSTQFIRNLRQVDINKYGRKYLFLFKRLSSTNSAQTQYDIPVENIRNFSIIAHVDHGKSTLADRLLETTGAIKTNSGKQILDTLQVEKDRGITVKAQTASLNYVYQGKQYLLNLIDTPGHVDFSAEVHRSLAPCQGVILLVDANDGVQAQTVANFHLASEKDLVIIPVINKIDLKNAKPDRVVQQLEELFSFDANNILKISAKLGTGVNELLEAVIKKIPPPPVCREKPFRALRFDSWFNMYKGTISLIYVTDGSITIGEQVSSLKAGKSYEVKNLWLQRPDQEDVKTLYAGQVGCLTCGMKCSKEAHVGDTLHLKNVSVEPLISFKPQRAMVYAGVYPPDQSQFNDLQSAIDRLILNDSSVNSSLDSSAALGRGWRLGFLGILHMEVFIQRLEQEYKAEPIVTAPSVTYKAKIFGKKNIVKYKGDTITFSNPVHFPDPVIVTEFYEPLVIGTIITPDHYVGEILKLAFERRGRQKLSKSIGNDRSMLQFVLPLNEIIMDFHDTLKSVTSGYASFDYEDHGFEVSDIVKLSIALNGRVVDELSLIVHRTKADQIGKKLCAKLSKTIPRQLIEIVVQAMVGAKVVARETIKAYKKDVTAKLYGGDVTRRQKLLAKQSEGKKKMKMIGNISLSRDTFISVLKR